MLKDGSMNVIPAFDLGSVEMSGLVRTPPRNTLVMLGADVEITMDEITLPCIQGACIVLRKAKTYNFAADIPLGIS